MIIFMHITFSVFWIPSWEIPRSEITEAKGTDIIIVLERYCQNALKKGSGNL